MTEGLHPATGYKYSYVIPSYDSYRDIRETYSRASIRLPWLEAFSWERWEGVSDRLLNDPTQFVVFIGSAPEVPAARKCRFAVYYCEMVGPPATLIDNQRGNFDRLVARAGNYDLLLARTPRELELFGQLLPKVSTALCPSGYDPEVFGRPDYSAKKERDLMFYGYRSGRRDQLIELLRKQLKHGMECIYGSYGPPRHALLNGAMALWNIPFSLQQVYGTFRIWEAISSSAPIITEPADTWPSVPGRHHFEIPPVTPENAESVASQIDAILDDRERLIEVARCAHDELSSFTPERCLAEYVVPASASLANGGTSN